ncbi:MAG TPA: NAD(P)H-binding protein [Vicinamibacterales bacterium]|nr:NAD(P)H-binding protein [Vicinamibacterales bacterium]
MRIVVTGANGSVGRNLLAHASKDPDVHVVAAVRSERAAAALPARSALEIRVVSPDDAGDLAVVLAGASSLVHLSGILIESRTASYEQANVAATQTAVDACRRAGVRHIVLVSALGADVRASNRYRRSKGEGERLVQRSGLDATIIRTPILLGPETAGAAGIVRSIAAGTARLLGGGRYLMRPLDIDDLSHAILSACRRPAAGVHIHELAGPEPISYRALIERVAGLMGRQVSYRGIPIWAAKLGAAINSRRTGGGVTPTVIDVITTSETVSHNADGDLGITLTPLSTTLDKIVTSWSRTR